MIVQKYERGVPGLWDADGRVNTITFYPVPRYGLSRKDLSVTQRDERLRYMRAMRTSPRYNYDYFEPLICTSTAIRKFKAQGVVPGIKEIELVLNKRQPRKAKVFFKIDEFGNAIGFHGGLYEGLRLLLQKAYLKGYRYAYLRPIT